MKPVKRVHLEGMGLTGSLLALCFHKIGVDFTWNDSVAEHTAWKACTGAIYPCGKPGSIDWVCYMKWREWLLKVLPAGVWEEAQYVFSQKTPPHEGRYPFSIHTGLHVAEPRSYHVNAQYLVPQVRNKFRKKRLAHSDVRYPIITAHGFSRRMTHAYWGWTRHVTLKTELDDRRRSAFYFREGRFIMAYAYPVPSTPYWYAGSSIIKQPAGKLHSLTMEDKYARWKANFERLGAGLVKVAREGDFMEGWRPAYAGWPDGKENWDGSWRWVGRVNDGKGAPTKLWVPPLWNSGLRHFPKVLEEVLSNLGHGFEEIYK